MAKKKEEPRETDDEMKERIRKEMLAEEPRETDDEMKERLRKEMAEATEEVPKESIEEQRARIIREIEADAETERQPKRARKGQAAPEASGASSSTANMGW